MLPMIAGALISGASSLLGGSMASKATKAANEEARRAQDQANRTAIALRDQDHERQERFAQSGIQWRVADAQKAGIHPLYALGATGASYSPSPVSVGTAPVAADTSMGTAVASMGQDISRALNSTRSSTERDAAFTKTVQDLSLQKLGLENELLASQISKLRAASNPPMPGAVASFPMGPIPEASKHEERPLLLAGGSKVATDPNTSNMQTFSDRWGDEGLASWVVPPYIMWQDLMKTSGGRPFTWVDNQTSIGRMPDLRDRPVEVGGPMPWHHQ